MTTLYATYRVPGDGVTTQFEFNFSGGYMDKSHVKAYIEDALTLARDPVEVLPSMFVGDFTLDLGVAAPVGSNMVIYRDTPKSGPLVDFVTGSRLTEANLDKVAQQSVFIGAEISDATNADVLTAATEAAQAVLDAAEAAALSEANAAASAVAADASEAAALASQNSASASAATATAQANTATTQAGVATTQAGISTTKASESSASAAASLASANVSTAQAVIATTQAGVSTAQANVATTQAGISITQATASAASAADAAASAAAAAASLDNFDDRYLGAKANAPTLDNDGNALVQGALYYNNGTVVADNKGMWVYDGAQWLKASAAAQAIMVTYRFVVAAGTTTISGTDADGKVLSYTPGSILVDANGALLYPPDYTASTGTSVVLATATTQASEEIVVFAFSTFNIANTYTKAEADAIAAAKVGNTGAETIAGVKTFSSRPLFSAGIDLNSNGQVKFPATQNPSSDANTLDDYEEGTWTPSWVATSGSMGYVLQMGRYVKVGRLVIATCHVITNANNALSGPVSLAGLPFTSDSSGSNYVACPLHLENVNIAASLWAWAHVAPNTTVANLRYWSNNSSAGTIGGASLGVSSDIMVTCTYMTTQ